MGVTLVLKSHTSPAGKAVVTSWLTRNHVRYTATRFSVAASASSARIERLLDVTLADYGHGKRSVYAATSAPVLPVQVASRLIGVLGLNDAPAVTTNVGVVPPTSISKSTSTRAATGSVSPSGAPVACSAASNYATYTESEPVGNTVRTMNTIGNYYGAGTLIGSGHDGTGKTVAVIEFSASTPSDVSAYDSCFGITDNYSVQQIDGGPTNGTPLEPDLDIEMIQTQAPGAKVISYEAPNTSTGNYDAVQAAVDNPAVSVISISWGQCESVYQSVANMMEPLYQQAAQQGQSIFVASGDYGSEGCYGYSTSNANQLAVEFPGSSPAVTAVGGVDTLSSGQNVVWNACGTSSVECSPSITSGNPGAFTGPGYGGASTGGVSSYESQPSWQVPVTGTYSGRAVPDISANANGNVIYYEGVWGDVYGTSAAAPLAAGLAADVEGSCASPTIAEKAAFTPAANQYGTLGNLSGSYNGLLQQMSAFQMGAQSNNMTPSQYLQFQANQAKAGNKQYQQQIAMQQAAITDTNQQLTELQNEAAGSPAVTSQVNGMQQLLTNNIKTQELLVSMNKNMEVANLNASQNAEAESADKAASIADQQKAAALQKQLSGMSVQLPTSSELMSASSASSSSSGNQP